MKVMSDKDNYAFRQFSLPFYEGLLKRLKLCIENEIIDLEEQKFDVGLLRYLEESDTSRKHSKLAIGEEFRFLMGEFGEALHYFHIVMYIFLYENSSQLGQYAKGVSDTMKRSKCYPGNYRRIKRMILEKKKMDLENFKENLANEKKMFNFLKNIFTYKKWRSKIKTAESYVEITEQDIALGFKNVNNMPLGKGVLLMELSLNEQVVKKAKSIVQQGKEVFIFAPFTFLDVNEVRKIENIEAFSMLPYKVFKEHFGEVYEHELLQVV